MGLKNRLKRLERAAVGGAQEFVCPRCGRVFGGRGDVALGVLVLDWVRESGASLDGGYSSPGPEAARILDHGHDELLGEVFADFPGLGRRAG